MRRLRHSGCFQHVSFSGCEFRAASCHGHGFPFTLSSSLVPLPSLLPPQVNGLFGSPLSPSQLVLAGLESEAAVSGYHADNVAPALLGGFVLVRSYRPLHLLPLAFPADRPLLFAVVTPNFEAPTRAMRAALPKEVRWRERTEKLRGSW